MNFFLNAMAMLISVDVVGVELFGVETQDPKGNDVLLNYPLTHLLLIKNNNTLGR